MSRHSKLLARRFVILSDTCLFIHEVWKNTQNYIIMSRNTFNTGITRYWWIPLVTGLIFVAFGIWCFVNPASSITVMAYCFCAGMLLAGILDISFSIANRLINPNWGWRLAMGLLEIALGVWLLFLPAPVLAVSFVYAVGIWMIVVAINSVCEAAVMSRYVGGAIVWMILALIATIVLACIFIINPLLGGVTVWLWLGLSLLTFGIYQITMSLNIKTINRDTDGLL